MKEESKYMISEQKKIELVKFYQANRNQRNVINEITRRFNISKSSVYNILGILGKATVSEAIEIMPDDEIPIPEAIPIEQLTGTGVLAKFIELGVLSKDNKIRLGNLIHYVKAHYSLDIEAFLAENLFLYIFKQENQELLSDIEKINDGDLSWKPIKEPTDKLLDEVNRAFYEDILDDLKQPQPQAQLQQQQQEPNQTDIFAQVLNLMALNNPQILIINNFLSLPENEQREIITNALELSKKKVKNNNF